MHMYGGGGYDCKHTVCKHTQHKGIRVHTPRASIFLRVHVHICMCACVCTCLRACTCIACIHPCTPLKVYPCICVQALRHTSGVPFAYETFSFSRHFLGRSRSRNRGNDTSTSGIDDSHALTSCMCICMHTRTHARTHARTKARTWTCMHICGGCVRLCM